MREVIDVKVIKHYKLLVTFDNRVRKIVNIEPFIKGPMFQPLTRKEFFREVMVDREAGTIVWPNEADIDPEVLYNEGKELKRTGQIRRSKYSNVKVYPTQQDSNVWSPRRKNRTKSRIKKNKIYSYIIREE
ncbi:DUF2442 domain-containing protein [Evansella tamaricis]|uniref:DUF2442 domain-containing protein n=1 Tax=Evansella tamaricis TaxID=2069301 RepID=A0ABS6JDM9_9BACI|nr:DUF2442 domain-containing protein [Evansella tamaricis]MBU9711686.1 DUF2442 domain-containing protein [Evansella tamaricis]